MRRLYHFADSRAHAPRGGLILHSLHLLLLTTSDLSDNIGYSVLATSGSSHTCSSQYPTTSDLLKCVGGSWRGVWPPSVADNFKTSSQVQQVNSRATRAALAKMEAGGGSWEGARGGGAWAHALRAPRPHHSHALVPGRTFTIYLLYICTNIYIYIYMCVYIYITYVYKYTRIYIYIYIYTIYILYILYVHYIYTILPYI